MIVCGLPASACVISGMSIALRPWPRRTPSVTSSTCRTRRRDRGRAHGDDEHHASSPRLSSAEADAGAAVRPLVPAPHDDARPRRRAAAALGRSSAAGRLQRRTPRAPGGSAPARRSRPTRPGRGGRRRRGRTRRPGCPRAGTRPRRRRRRGRRSSPPRWSSRPTASHSASTYGFERETCAGGRMNVARPRCPGSPGSARGSRPAPGRAGSGCRPPSCTRRAPC